MAKPRSIGDYLPSSDTGPSLEESGIEGTVVTIAAVAFENRRGLSGDYTLSVITLDDGQMIHTGSKVIAERLGMIEPAMWPLQAVFTRVKSVSNPRNSYWTVNGPESKEGDNK